MSFWKLKDGTVIRLITPKELTTLPQGTRLRDIFGELVTVGKDKIDEYNTWGGYLAFGIPSTNSKEKTMTKNELVSEIAIIYRQLEELNRGLAKYKWQLERIMEKVSELPDSPKDITEDEE